MGQAFRQAGADRGGALGAGEFSAYYRGAGASRARLELRSTLGPATEREALSLLKTLWHPTFCRSIAHRSLVGWQRKCSTPLTPVGWCAGDLQKVFCSFASFGVRQVSAAPACFSQSPDQDLPCCHPFVKCLYKWLASILDRLQVIKITAYAQHLEEMDGAKFAKLCRDTKLLTRGFTPTDVDLFFAKVRALTHLLLPEQALLVLQAARTSPKEIVKFSA